MKLSQVAAITYTIRDFCQTEADFRASMKKLADIGFQAVQVSSRPKEMSPAAILEACDDAGLTICATHEPSHVLLDNPEQAVATLEALNCKYTAYPYPGDIKLADPEALADFTKKLDHAGAVLREAGQVLTYHNHAIEFAKVADKTILDHIYDNTAPNNVQGEIDVYWVQAGGGCPVEWCRKLAGRLPLLHLKDLGVISGNQSDIMEIGAGNLNFKSIIAAAEAGGCEWFIVEQDSCPGDPFDSLRQSFEYIQANLIQTAAV